MARPSCQLDFLKQIQAAKSEIQIHFRRLLSSVDELQRQTVHQIQTLEDEYRREMEDEEQLTRLAKQICKRGKGKQYENRLNSITNDVDQLVSERNSKLLVLDWDFSIPQILLETFCKVSVKQHPSSPPKVNEDKSFIDSVVKLNMRGKNTRPTPDAKIPYSGSIVEVHTTPLSLEQRYKETRCPTFTCSANGSDPRGVGIDDTTGEIYVADFKRHCIFVFDEEGSYFRRFTHNKMVNPVGIYVSYEFDRLFVTVSGRAAVQCYKLDGTFTKEILCYNRSGLEFNNPAGITMDSGERVYVCDQGNNRVPVFTRFLVFITVLTTQVSDPRDVKAVGSEVAILHSGEYCVSFFTRGGLFLRNVVKQGLHKQKVGNPSFFCIDSDGNILLSDTDNDCIKVYRSTGFHICNIGRRGNCEGEFRDPAGMALFNNCSLVTVCDRDDNQLQIFHI